jgi:hypothetical protein
MILGSVIICPQCGHQETETMPTDCQFFYDCKGCGEVLRPKEGNLLRVLLLRLGTVPADPGSTGKRDRRELLRVARR